MEISIKTQDEIQAMREGGKILAETLEETLKMAKPGVSTYELDQFAENFIRQKGAIPGFKGYRGFPATLCTCLNEKIVHSIPRKDEFIKEGDLLTIDCGVIYKGLYTDAARSIGIGNIPPLKKNLIKTAYLALDEAINTIKPGVHLGEISKAIQRIIEKEGFCIVKDLTGHGLGKTLHEPPEILNYWDGKPGPELKEGMTLAIEPIFATTTGKMVTLKDNWTLVTEDGSCAVQVENTILITKDGAEILTA